MRLQPSDRKDSRPALRQWLLTQLANSYFYPSEWIAERASMADAPIFGFSLNTSKGDPFIWASVDKSADEAERRLRLALEGAPYARIGISSDGSLKGTCVLRRKPNSTECEYVVDLEPFTLPDLISPYAAPKSERSKGRPLEPISSTVENVLFEAHSHIRDIDGLHADEALDELCKILYAKLYDEEMTPPGDPYTFQRGATGSAEEFAAVIRRTYDDANQYDVRVFSLKVPGYERSRGVFNSAIRLSSPALVRVAETLHSYWFTRSSIDIKGRAFQRVLGPSLRAGMGQYFTPLEVIHFMTQVAGPTVSDLILDPFSGSGHFLTQCLDLVRRSVGKSDAKRIDEFAYNKLHGIEKSDRMVRVAMTDMRLHGDGHSNIRCTDALLDFQNYSDIRPESFDLILTNPPFGSLLGAEAIGQLGKFELTAGRKNVPLEVLGLERCLQFLRPGGKLGIVLPDGILANRGTQYVREWLHHHVKLRAIVSLPIETFSPFGANIKTSIIFARKWKCGEARTSEYAVHLSRIDNIGYDATGRGRSGTELPDARSAIREFLRNEGW